MQGRFPPVGRNSDRGAILVTVIILFAFFSTIGLSLIALLYAHITSIQVEIDRLKALYLAEAGIAQSLYEMRVGQDADDDGLGSIKSIDLGGGRFWVEHNMEAATITSTGEHNNIKRIVQIRYNVI